ncbi:MAG TPA: carboxypeptidase regulatory-like domain-containing protein [Candidatus Acidoferrum sp.]|nr:carboxypeptidase regulatory-like domain-containing protein [Candidatus Acidoferrum sp.]
MIRKWLVVRGSFHCRPAARVLARLAIILALAFLTISPEVRGQGNQGAIEGSVADPSGAAVAGARLTAIQDATGTRFEAASSPDGLFTFPVLPVGSYTIEVVHPGFAKLTRKNITVTVGARVNLDLALSVAGQTSEITVTGAPPILETTRSQVSSTVNDTAIENLPTNGRNFINFALLTPGVTLDVRGGDISFAGQRGTLNSLIVDGSDNNNTFFGQTVGRTGSGRAPYQFSEDAVQEFQVNSNAYSAEFGHAGGAVINVITKSGTNDFHGSVFEFYRDQSLNANDPINIINNRRKSPYHFNQFGGDVGGPVLRDKLFFFFDYDGQRNTLPNLVFLGVAPPATPTANQQKALAYLQARNNSWVRTQNQNVYLAKADWHATATELASIRYNAQRFVGAGFENGGPQNAFEHTGASDVTTDTLSGSLTSTLSSAIVNSFRAGYTRDNEPGQANSVNPEATIRQGGITDLVVGRNFFSPRFTNIHRGEFGDTLSLIRGRHTLKAGANVLVDKIANFFPGNFSGAYVFNSLEGFGCDLNGGGAACFTGPDAGDTFTQAFAGPGTSGATTNPNLQEYSFFGQDEWRFRSNLTLNLGLRYDLDLIAQPPVLNPAASLAAAGIVTNRIHNDRANFGPRIGVAWTPLAGNKLVVRTGYGIFYGRTPAITVGTAFSNNALNVQTLTFTGAAIPQYPNTKCGAPTLTPNCAPPAGGTSALPTIFVFQPGYHEPNVQQANLGLEYQLQPTMAVQINYLWVKGTHLTRTLDVNLQGPETPVVVGFAGSAQTTTINQITQPRPIAGFSRIEEFQSSANSIYNGLIVQVNKRFSQNYQFLASYTYGKVIDDNPDATSVVPFSSDDAKMVQDPLNLRGDRSPGVNDQRHRFVFSPVWDLDGYAHPFSRPWRYLLGGWQLSAILTAESGQPYSAMVNSDLNKDSNSRTDRAPGVGRDTFYLPNFVSLDPRITKSIPITERVKAQLILEAYNSLNTTNFTSVSTTEFSAGAAGCAPTAAICLGAPRTPFQFPLSTSVNFSPGARIVQLSGKITF